MSRFRLISQLPENPIRLNKPKIYIIYNHNLKKL